MRHAAEIAEVEQWDYDAHPGDCHPRIDGSVWTVCCRECAGTGVFPVPWVESVTEGRRAEDAGCVACKETGRAVVAMHFPPGQGGCGRWRP
jgi:hypothetical protein